MAELTVGGLVDPTSHERTGDLAALHSQDLTTHGVIVGMTGSGKTGLGVDLVEEVLLAGLPALVIDPKGDLTNLGLMFPDLSAAEFRPWIDEAQATAEKMTPDEFAAAQATAWTAGLAGWDYGTEQIRRLRATADLTIYTPGSQAGQPVNIVGSLRAPDTDDTEIVNDDIEGYVSGLLGLIDVDADPLSSREHILLSNLIQHAWSNDEPLDLAVLVGQVQHPPIKQLGVLELDQFFPAKDREQLARRLNGLLASPSFATWGQGAPLDIQSMLYTASGSPRCAIVTTSHLSDEERQFVTSIVLSKLVTWMRRQSGTSDLRALLYMDEVHGYLPPTAAPPTKKPMMTLMKTARAFGVGVVLSTQNPVDIDYKAIANAGTWMIGRLQTERDKKRLLDGMTSAAGEVDVKAVGDRVSGLEKREFVLRRAGTDQPEQFTTRWAMSYLRGPLTKDQIKRLTHPDPEKGSNAEPTDETVSSTAPAPDPATGATESVTASAPDRSASDPKTGVGSASEQPDSERSEPFNTVPAAAADGIAVRWAEPTAPWLADIGGDAGGESWEAAIVATAHVRFDESKAELVVDRDASSVLFPLDAVPDVARAVPITLDPDHLSDTAPDGASYRFPDAPIAEAATWKKFERALIDHIVRSDTLELHVNKALKLYSRPEESTEEFAARCLEAAVAAADAAKTKASSKHDDKVATLQRQREAAEDRATVVTEQAKERKRGNLIHAATDVIGGIFGSRTSATSRVGRAADRLTRSSDGARVDEANEKVARFDQQRVELDAALAEETTAIDATWNDRAIDITTMDVGLERTDVKVAQLLLVWIPVP